MNKERKFRLMAENWDGSVSVVAIASAITLEEAAEKLFPGWLECKLSWIEERT